MKNKLFLLGISFVFSIVITMIVGSRLFCNYDKLYISISPYSEKNVFTEGDKISVKSITVDGVKYKASDIFQGNWTKMKDGELQYQSYTNSTSNNSIKALVPAGKTQKVTFNADRWSGMVRIQLSTGKSFIKDLYSLSNSNVNVSFDITGQKLKINYMGYIISFIICFIGFYILVLGIFYLLTGKIEIIQNFSGKNLLYKFMFLLSGTSLSAIMSLLCDNLWCVWVSTCIAFVIYFIIIFNYDFLKKINIKRNLVYFICSLPFSIYCFSNIFVNRITYLNNIFGNKSISYFAIFLVFPIVALINFYFLTNAADIVKEFYIESEKFEKLYFVVFMTIISIVILVIYSKTSGFSYGYYLNGNGQVGRQWADIIYDFDHSWVLDSYTDMSEHFYNIRHPLFRVYSLPAAFIASSMSVCIKLAYPLAYPAILAIINAFFMGISTIILKRLTNENLIMPLFSITYMFLILCLGSEQYQISLFFILSSIYAYVKKRKSSSSFNVIMMSGTTLTSGFLVPFLTEFKNIKQYIIDLLKYCVVFFISMCVLGVGYIVMSTTELLSLLKNYGGTTYTFVEKLKVYTHFIKWCFIAPKSEVVNSSTGNPVFTGVFPNTFSLIGCIILIICIISFISLRKNKYIRICFISVVFSFILCAIVGWAMYTVWLYSILFSWAYISLIVMYLKNIVKSRTLFKIIIICIVIIMLIINIETLKDLIEFCIRNYGVIKP